MVWPFLNGSSMIFKWFSCRKWWRRLLVGRLGPPPAVLVGFFFLPSIRPMKLHKCKRTKIELNWKPDNKPYIIFAFHLHYIGFPNGVEMETIPKRTLYYIRIPSSHLNYKIGKRSPEIIGVFDLHSRDFFYAAPFRWSTR